MKSYIIRERVPKEISDRPLEVTVNPYERIVVLEMREAKGFFHERLELSEAEVDDLIASLRKAKWAAKPSSGLDRASAMVVRSTLEDNHV